MTRARLERLRHDVGKYVARVARNLDGGPLPDGAVELLLCDLYALDGARPASAVFEALAAGLSSEALDEARGRLRAIDAIEAAVRRGDEAAVRRAAALAREVEALIARACAEAR